MRWCCYGFPTGTLIRQCARMCHYENIWSENCPTKFKLLCIEDMWTTPFYFFAQQIMYKNLKCILTSNQNKLSLHLKLKNNGLLSFLQSWPKRMRQRLVLMWNSTPREKFNLKFWTVFCLYWHNFHFGRGIGH